MAVRSEVEEYLEPCVFGGSVYLALPRFGNELVGDVNPDVVNLWRVLSNQAANELLEIVIDTPYEIGAFEEAQTQSTNAITQAARFIIRRRFSRGGLGETFAWSERERGGQPGDANAWETFGQHALPKIIDRANGVRVLNDPCWVAVWESRMKSRRLIYADPPYMADTRTSKSAYGQFEMTRLHHFWLAAALRAHSGPAAISGYRNYDYDFWFKDWRRTDFEVSNNAGQTGKKQKRIESLWTNY
jgi:site-specific DNA-adenine methylase